MSALAPKKEAFAQAVAAGATLADAYRQTRDCSKMKPSTVRANAKKLAREPVMKARIEELKRRESGSPRESPPLEEAVGPSGLTPKQESFCWLYIEKSSASEAYRTAYDVGPDTKPESIHRSAAELLANPKITSRVEAIRAELRKRHEITVDALVDRLRPIIDADIRKVLTWGDAVPITDPETGEVRIAQGIALKSMADLDADAVAMIAKIRQSRDGSLSVELYDKLAAIEKVARLLGLIKDQHDVKVEDITPRPQDPGREAMRAAIRRVRAAARDYEARVEAEQAEKALPPAGRNGAAEH